MVVAFIGATDRGPLLDLLTFSLIFLRVPFSFAGRMTRRYRAHVGRRQVYREERITRCDRRLTPLIFLPSSACTRAPQTDWLAETKESIIREFASQIIPRIFYSGLFRNRINYLSKMIFVDRSILMIYFGRRLSPNKTTHVRLHGPWKGSPRADVGLEWNWLTSGLITSYSF